MDAVVLQEHTEQYYAHSKSWKANDNWKRLKRKASKVSIELTIPFQLTVKRKCPALSGNVTMQPKLLIRTRNPNPIISFNETDGGLLT